MIKGQKKGYEFNKIALVIAVVHFVLSFFTDRLIFDYTVFDFSDGAQSIKSLITVAVKTGFLIMVVFIWQWLFWFFTRSDARFRTVAILYFVLNAVLLLLIWPGIWRMDEFGILSSAIHLYPSFWQNYLTSVFYIFSLMLLPFPTGIVIIQIAVISIMIARVFCNLTDMNMLCYPDVENSPVIRGKRGENEAVKQNGQRHGISNVFAGMPVKNQWILLIPFVMFPVLDSNLYPMRMDIWAFLEMTILSELLKLYFARENGEIRKMKDNTANNAGDVAKTLTLPGNELSDDFSTTYVAICGKHRCQMVVLCVSAAALTVWRTEAVYYLLFFPLLLFLIYGRHIKSSSDEKRQTNRRFFLKSSCLKYVLLYIICFAILFVPQKAGERYESGQQYELTGMVLPLAQLVEAADANGDSEDERLLKITDRVINVRLTADEVRKGKNGINLFWGYEDFQRDYTREDFSALKAVYPKLILKYPAVFLKERITTFIESRDLLMDTTKLFEDEENPNYKAFRDYPLSGPVSKSVRTAVINALEIRKPFDNTVKLPGYGFVYCAVFPIIILIIAAGYFIIRKRYFEMMVVCASLVKVPLIFLTAPSRLFMYYYPVYLTGYAVLFYVIFRCTLFKAEGKAVSLKEDPR